MLNIKINNIDYKRIYNSKLPFFIFLTLIIGCSNKSMSDSTKTELATLGGGCFWCMEAVFQQIPGVISVTSGYSGGFTKNPTYKEVCEGNTGHAEVIQIKFNPEKISYSQILDIFWKAHDPTSLNRQGADIGTQYRSIILYHNDEQRKIAEASRAKASKDFAKPIVTEIMPFTAFYKAEEYHQNFFKNNPEYGYCQAVIKPKLEKLKEVLKSNESKPNPH